MNDMMLEATRLTRANRLIEATALIQRMLQGEIDPEIADPGDRRPTIGGHPEIFDETKPFPLQRGGFRSDRIISRRCGIQHTASNSPQGTGPQGWKGGAGTVIHAGRCARRREVH